MTQYIHTGSTFSWIVLSATLNRNTNSRIRGVNVTSSGSGSWTAQPTPDQPCWKAKKSKLSRLKNRRNAVAFIEVNSEQNAFLESIAGDDKHYNITNANNTNNKDGLPRSFSPESPAANTPLCSDISINTVDSHDWDLVNGGVNGGCLATDNILDRYHHQHRLLDIKNRAAGGHKVIGPY